MEDKPSLLPNWAISHQDALDLIPESGFLHDYIAYKQTCTDAPLIYHYGVAMTILSSATSGADIICRGPKRTEGEYVLPTPIWSALIGVSGAARKSSSMASGINLLVRAKSQCKDPEIILPNDGSLEGWHDYMVSHNQVILYRDELAVLFDQARRGYSEGLKHWLMEIYSGDPKSRSTVKEVKAEDNKTIERPRLAILGGIPPDTFSQKSSRADWLSGFLARFVFWAGDREWYNRRPARNLKIETALARWLAAVACRVTGYIEVPDKCREALTDWHIENVESRWRSFAPEFLSHLIRYESLGLRLTAMHAVSRSSSHKNIAATLEDVEFAVKALTLLRGSSGHLYANSQKDVERDGEDEILEFLKRRQKPVSPTTILKNLSISRTTLGRRLKALFDGGDVNKRKSYSIGVGRPSWLYYLPKSPKMKTKMGKINPMK